MFSPHDDTPHIVVWVSADRSQFSVIKNIFKDGSYSHETIKDGFSSRKEAQDYYEAYYELEKEICDAVLNAVKREFPTKAECITPHSDIVLDLGGDTSNLISIFVRLNETIGIDENHDCTRWRTPLDIFQCYKSILNNL